MTVVLIGGGWNDTSGYRAFLEAAGSDPVVACLVIDEGDGAEYGDRFITVLRSVAPCRPRPVLVPLGTEIRPGFLDEASALLVCGGLTPAYATALTPVREEIRARVADGMPYAGFSAGSAVAADTAIVGGYRIAGRVVCPEDAAEDLGEVSVVPGLGLVSYTIDVHAAQWGTLGRLQGAVSAGLADIGMAIDEDSALVLDRNVDGVGSARVVGTGAVHLVRATGDGVTVTDLTAGNPVRVPEQ